MNKSLKCIIVDDEPPAIRVIENYLEKIPHLKCVASTGNSIEALKLIDHHQPDILFLDIQMPNLSGIQLSKLISTQTKIIFTTAYAEFAVEGFELNAVDYLLKPISFSRFYQSIEKVEKTGAEIARKIEENSFFFVKTDGKNRFKKIDLNSVLYLESIKNYVILHTEDEQIVTYNTLKHFEKNLPENSFIKIHKSYIVAIHKIEKTDNNEVIVKNKNLPLGNSYKDAFFQKINQKKI